MRTYCQLLAVIIALATTIRADGPTKNLLEPATQLQPSSAQVNATRTDTGLAVTIQPGKEGYPGVRLAPAAGHWDLSAYGHVEARVINTGAKAATVALRVDNPSDHGNNPWNTEQAYLKPGATNTIAVIFGFAYGHKPNFQLNPAKVANLLLFTIAAKTEQSFRVESLLAAGPAGEKPPVDPDSIRLKPANGVLTNVVKQVEGGSLTWKPTIGRWDLSEATEVRVQLKNAGPAAVSARVQVISNGGPTDTITAEVAAGAGTEVVVPFAAATPWHGIPNSGDRTSWDGVKSTGTKFGSDAVSAIKVTGDVVIESVRAAAPPADLPAWLGQHPPVAGDWVKTFDENFDGPTIDLTKWNHTGPNYWDKLSHWSTNHVVLAHGCAALHYEKKTGYHNDDPKQKKTDYTGGYLDTYGKWTQRYGYFEARLKLPQAPGLWPAFWLMPDRGPADAPQWKRADTGNGGMEFDIMEHLTRWGPHRYNIAMHWDGYGKGHKQTGTQNLYVQSDKDGFITAGLLWTPGSAIYYCNGREIARWEDPRISSVPSNMLIEMVTGGWDNNWIDDARLPVDFVIDYVRVWQRQDLASPTDGPQPAAKPAKP